jgi:hypothetical protein
MNRQGDDQELKAAFAEFKELLRRDSEFSAVAESEAPEVSLTPEIRLAPEISFASESAAAPVPPPLFAAEQEPFRVAAPSRAAPRVSQATAIPPEARRAAPVAEDALFVSEPEAGGGRRKLIYLSVAVVVAGLAAMGWTLSTWRGPAEAPSIANVAPPAELDAGAPPSEAATLEQPATNTAPAPAGSEKAEAVPLPGVDAPAAAETAAAPAPAATTP